MACSRGTTTKAQEVRVDDNHNHNLNPACLTRFKLTTPATGGGGTRKRFVFMCHVGTRTCFLSAGPAHGSGVTCCCLATLWEHCVSRCTAVRLEVTRSPAIPVWKAKWNYKKPRLFSLFIFVDLFRHTCCESLKNVSASSLKQNNYRRSATLSPMFFTHICLFPLLFLTLFFTSSACVFCLHQCHPKCARTAKCVKSGEEPSESSPAHRWFAASNLPFTSSKKTLISLYCSWCHGSWGRGKSNHMWLIKGNWLAIDCEL